MSTQIKLNFLDSSSPLIEQISFFHDHTILMIVIILTAVAHLITNLITNKKTNRIYIENQTLETLWTILPSTILILIAIPSLKILYLTDETENPSITLKIIGHQWYWSYEYPDFKNKEFDSYMTQLEEPRNYRLLDVDNRTVLPIKTTTRIILSSTDVIHAWTIPSIGVKIDAVPGRLNQINTIVKLPGVFFGQCSEICGANHSFIPITLEVSPIKNFTKWITQN